MVQTVQIASSRLPFDKLRTEKPLPQYNPDLLLSSAFYLLFSVLCRLPSVV